jgi:hypothetical protein
MISASADKISDEGPRLAIWGAAEVAVTIMAACIPVMRVLFRDVVTQARSYRDKWTGSNSGDRSASQSAARHGTGKFSAFAKSQNSTIISSIGPPVPPKESSEKSFLDTSSGEASPSMGYAERTTQRTRPHQIVQTSEVTVKWSRSRQNQNEYELSPV